MIQSAKVQRFRGIPRLEISGFGRVNLIIGKNDCGKTALLEALELLDDVGGAARLLWLQQRRRDEDALVFEFERFWEPIFWQHNVLEGIDLSAQLTGGAGVEVRVAQVASTGPTVLKGENPESAALHSPGDPPRRRNPMIQNPWALNVSTRSARGQASTGTITVKDGDLHLPRREYPDMGSAWVATSASIGEGQVRDFSELKRTGREPEIVELLQEVDPNVTGLELLAPSGKQAEIFVRMGPDFPPLPITMMGDGFQRCLEMGLAAAANEWPTFFVDEFDNGLHHSVLERVWRWVALMATTRDVQVFASTHSEECIHAACRAFSALNDDGLRVIRLDRHGDSTTAAIYDCRLLQVAAEAGIEVRG